MGPVIDCVVFDLDGTLTVPGGVGAVPGVDEVLATLAGAGVELAVATSAPTARARRVLADLDLDGWFASVAGAAPNARMTAKDAIVADALLGLGRPLPEGADRTAVVGDGLGDMQAAVRHGLLPIGVTWSGASAGALRAAGAVVVVDEPAAVAEVVGGAARPAGP